MLAVSNQKHPNVNECVTVRVKAFEIAIAKTDAYSILVVILNKTENGF